MLWLSRMNLYYNPGQFKNYIDHSQIGCIVLAADDLLLLHMMHGMALSAKNVDVYYNVIKVLDLNCT